MRPSLLALAACSALSAPSAQTSLRQEKHTLLGLALAVPSKYTPIPVQPTEPFIVLRYVGEDRRGPAPELYVARIDWQPDPEPPSAPPPVTNFTRYLEQELPEWLCLQERSAKTRAEGKATEHDLELRGQEDKGTVGWVYELQAGPRTWAVIGFSGREEADKHKAAWRKCAEKLEFFEPSAPVEIEKWRKLYERRPQLKNPQYRIAVRSRLVDGWDSEDTENFLFVYSTRKEVLMRDLEKKLEGLRKHFLARFPPLAEITAVSTVRVCQDEAEYRDYGGPSGTAGYWNAAGEELVFYEAGKADTRITLYHEAFHQYIHYAVGELDPHDWFNEGYGDYFSGAEFNAYGEVIRIRVNPWRVPALHYALRENKQQPWSKMIRMERSEYYDEERAPFHYAMGWSMVYFLEQSKDAQKHPAWTRILPTYFETLKSANQREKERLAAAGTSEQAEELAKARAAAREQAVAAAFRSVDLRALESAWFEFVRELKLPK